MTKQEVIDAINEEIQFAKKIYDVYRDRHTSEGHLTMFGYSWKLDGLEAALEIVKALDD